MDRWILLATYCIRKLLFCGSVKSNGVILEDIVRQLDTTSTVVAWSFAIQNGITYLISPMALLLLTSFSSRQLCIFGGIITGFGYIFCGMFLNAVWQLVIFMIISGLGFGLLTLPMYVVLQEHFTTAQLPKVITFLGLFDYVGIATVPVVMQFFRSQYGLKNSMILFGAVLWNTVVSGVAAKSPRQQIIKSADKQEKTMKTESQPSKGKTWKKLRACIPRIFNHNNVFILLVLEFVGFYVFTSWALFLVSLGRSLGLSDEEAVFLATAGGIGGLTGRIITFCLFQVDMANALNTCLIPLTVTGTAFLALAFAVNKYAVTTLIFISGVSQGMNTSALFALLPSLVCRYHYKHVVNLVCICIGIATQAAGLLSGLIQDATDCTIYVYLCNAVICFAMLPLVLWWACDDEVNLEC